MKIQWRFKFHLKLLPLVLLLPYSVAAFGPSRPPDSISNYTLEDICARLDSGADGTSSNFSEPMSAQGTTVSCTLNQMMEKAPKKDEVNGALPSDVVQGKTYWGLRESHWGLQTGMAFPSAVAKTGATVSNVTGDDGDLQKGVTVSGNRFTDNGEGTVTDNLTGLIWLKNADCVGTSRTWNTALSDVAQLNTNGTMNGNDCGDTGNQTDWRLPNVKELQSLIDFSNHSPALPRGHPFLTVQTIHYWSSTLNLNPTYAWSVNFGNGVASSNNKIDLNEVWPVRGGN